ncbi:MAG TPA: TetR/AcrR family transcriptional regulator [Steroidobacter sp.]|uniref:TetR/AcrR family transcriptional regulator n=1 Tax=Steroidobacter sp. TaxID=1978227 RepID=UPI002ED78AF6
MNPEKREQVIEIARQLFLTYGAQRTCMDEVCKLAHVSKKTLYSAFRSKEDLFNAVYIHEVDSYMSRLDPARVSGDSSLQKLEQMIRLAIECSSSAAFFVTMAKRDFAYPPPLLQTSYADSIEPKVTGFISQVLEQGMASGEIRPVPVTTAAYMIYRLVQGFTVGKGLSVQGTAEEIAFLIDFIRAALAAQSTAAEGSIRKTL